MGTLYLRMKIGKGYGNADFQTELALARVRDEQDRELQQRIDLTLESLSGPLSRLMLGAAMVAQDELTKAGFPGGLVPPPTDEPGEDLKEVKYSFELEIEHRFGYEYNSKKQPVAKLNITLEVYVREQPKLSDLALQLDFLEKAVSGMCRDVLIANRVADPLPEPLTGDDATEVTKALLVADNAWTIARQLERAISDKLAADNATLVAKERLQEIMAQTREPVATL